MRDAQIKHVKQTERKMNTELKTLKTLPNCDKIIEWGKHYFLIRKNDDNIEDCRRCLLYDREDGGDGFCAKCCRLIGDGFYVAKELTREEVDGTQAETSTDAVNHPSHYTSDPSGVECIQITRHRSFCVGNAIKYLWRAGLKHDADKTDTEKQIEDLQKAVWYINQEIELIKQKGR